MPERRLVIVGSRTHEHEYRPEAAPWKYGYVTFGNGKLAMTAGDGWVRIYGDGLNYPYVQDGKVIGGPRG